MRSSRAVVDVILALCLGAGAALAAPLAEPALTAGENIRRESGEITVNAAAVTVVRYTWRDSLGDPRSVSLVPASPTTMGYAVQMSYVIDNGATRRTAYINADPGGDGGFGYFVSHELVRQWTDNSPDDTIASRHAADDSPLGRNLPSTGSAFSAGATQAAHEFRLSYPRWGTVASIPQPDGVAISPNAADHRFFSLPVIVRWHFVMGFDYPLWSMDFDLTAAEDHISTDVRAPYGVMSFNEGVGPAVTMLKWGDRYHFVADAGTSEFSAIALPSVGVSWNWSSLNNGRRYHALGSGAYEFGLVDTLLYTASRTGDGYTNDRGSTRAAAGPCPYGLRSMPCDFEWAYQSFQYDYGPPARPKLAWGTSPFLGSSTTTVYYNFTGSEPINPKGHIHYGLHIVFGHLVSGAARTLARAGTAMEANPTLGIASAPAQGGSVSYTVLGDAGGPYTQSGRTLVPWDSVRLNAVPAPGYNFSEWTGACAGVASASCLITMDQAHSVTASFTTPPSANPGHLYNLSTRMQALTGNDVMIGGFVIGGSADKTVVVRARGPSLVPYGIANALMNPQLQLVRSSDQSTLAVNDDWQGAANAAAVTSSGFAPSDSREAAILVTLPPGAYTAIVSGVGNTTGVAIVEVFEVDRVDVPLINIATRGQVLTGNDVMIGGFVIQGDTAQTVVVRARGPSLVPFGIANALANPQVQLIRSSDQSTLAMNNDWGDAPNAPAIAASGFAPSNSLESAILMTLDPGAYTAIVSGVGGGTGVGIVEVFAVP